jgi:acyl-coenzyme A synthetase/AMP-(fatty) acid ligase
MESLFVTALPKTRSKKILRRIIRAIRTENMLDKEKGLTRCSA